MKKLKGVLSAIIASSAFGMLPFFALPPLHHGMSPTSVLFYRNLFCAILLTLYCLILKKRLWVPFKLIWKFAIFSAMYISSSTCLVYAYKFIPSGLATTIHFVYPIGVTLIMIFLFKEKKSFLLFFLAVMSLVGVALLCWQGKTIADYRGILLTLETVIVYSIYIVSLSRVNMLHTPNEVVILYILTGNAILLAIISAFTGFTPIPSVGDGANILSMAVISTIVANILLLSSVKNVGPTVTSILGSMEPLMATVLGIAYFNEPYGWNSILGFLIIIGAVIAIILYNNKQAKQIAKVDSQITQ